MRQFWQKHQVDQEHTEELRQALRRRGIIPRIARRGTLIKRAARSISLGRGKGTLVAQPLPATQGPRTARRADIHQAFLTLGCSLICWQASNR